MKKPTRWLACCLPMSGCGVVLLLVLLALVWPQRPSHFGSLKGEHVWLIGWQRNRDSAGWYSLGLPQRRYIRITDAQGMSDIDLHGSDLGALQGNLLVSVAFQEGGFKTSLRCWSRLSEDKWQLSQEVPLPFEDRLYYDPASKHQEDKKDEYACSLNVSPKGTYVVLAWLEGKQVNIYDIDLKSGKMRKVAQLPAASNDYSELHVFCSEDRSVYVLDNRDRISALIRYDSIGSKHILPSHKDISICQDGNYAIDSKAKGVDIEVTVSNLDHPERACESYHCNALDALNHLKPGLLKRTGKCNANKTFVSSDGKWLVTRVSIEDRMVHLKPGISFSFYMVWRRHEREAVYGYYPVDEDGNIEFISVASNK